MLNISNNTACLLCEISIGIFKSSIYPPELQLFPTQLLNPTVVRFFLQKPKADYMAPQASHHEATDGETNEIYVDTFQLVKKVRAFGFVCSWLYPLLC